MPRNMSAKFLFFSLFIFYFFPSASANTQIGHGLATCAQYNQSVAESSAAEATIDAWVLGYLSGVNYLVHTTKGVDFLATGNSDIIKGFIQGYCMANPGKTVTEAANEFWLGLYELLSK
jgi:hypothetical protein